MTRVREALTALRMLRCRDWHFVVAGVLLFALVALAGYSVLDSARARVEITRQAEVRSEQADDMRQAQTRRIDRLEDDMRRQARTVGRLCAQVEVLAGQVRRLGGSPVLTRCQEDR